MEFTEYDTRLAAYAVIVDDQERVLLALFNQGPTPRWTLPGGGVELHETLEQGVVREVREESGYDVRLGRLLGIDTAVIPVEQRMIATDRPMKTVRVLFEAEVIRGELTHELDGTTDEARWIPLDELPALPRKSVVDTALALVQAAQLSRERLR